MKKCIKNLLALALSLSLLIPAAACGNKEYVPNTPTDIEMVYWQSGLGIEFLEKIIEDFETANPEYKVYLKPSFAPVTINSTLMLGETGNTVDLYFTVFSDYNYVDDYENLDDVLDSVCEGETKTIREKYDGNILASLTKPDGKVNLLSYGGGLSGMCYNSDYISVDDLPKTSNELENLTFDLKAKNIVPYVHFSNEGYYLYLSTVWQAQYDGLGYYNDNFLKLKDPVTGTAPSKDVLTKKDGRWKAMQALESIFTEQTVLTNSNQMEHVAAQTRFINGDAAMMYNGEWMQNEMKNSGGRNDKFGMMKTPVISSIIDRCQTIGSDSVLSDVVAEIDAVTEGRKTMTLTGNDDNRLTVAGHSVSEKDWKRVCEARNIMQSNSCEQVAMIPKYSNAKDGAKLFLKYFYSDKGLETYIDYTRLTPPVHPEKSVADQTGWTTFEKQVYEYNRTALKVHHCTEGRSEVFRKGSAHPYGATRVVQIMTSKGVARKDADTLWTEISKKFNDNWDLYLKDAGLR